MVLASYNLMGELIYPIIKCYGSTFTDEGTKFENLNNLAKATQ